MERKIGAIFHTLCLNNNKVCDISVYTYVYIYMYTFKSGFLVLKP